MNYSPKVMQQKLDDENFKFKKHFGQNFIIDENIIDNIIRKSNIDNDTLVIEVGPGAGSLTCGIAKYAKNVLCYEIDKDIENVLKNNIKDFKNVDIIFSDFLKANVSEDIKKYNYKQIFLIANLPYYITTPIIMKVIDDNIDIKKIVIMVQKEVGDRFKALPKTKDYGSLTVFLNYYYNISKLMDVSRNVFLPKPNVDSIVVEFSKKEDKIKVNDEKIFFALIKDSFKQKRKTLKNNLREYNLDIIEKILLENNFSLSSRAEEIPIDVYAKIANGLSD